MDTYLTNLACFKLYLIWWHITKSPIYSHIYIILYTRTYAAQYKWAHNEHFPSQISNYTHHDVLDEIDHPFQTLTLQPLMFVNG